MCSSLFFYNSADDGFDFVDECFAFDDEEARAITRGEDRAACEDAYWDWQCVEPFGTGKVHARANGCGDERGRECFGDGDIDICAYEDECEDEADNGDGVHAYGDAYGSHVMGEIGGEDEQDEGLRRREFCNAFGAACAVE